MGAGDGVRMNDLIELVRVRLGLHIGVLGVDNTHDPDRVQYTIQVLVPFVNRPLSGYAATYGMKEYIEPLEVTVEADRGASLEDVAIMILVEIEKAAKSITMVDGALIVDTGYSF